MAATVHVGQGSRLVRPAIRHRVGGCAAHFRVGERLALGVPRRRGGRRRGSRCANDGVCWVGVRDPAHSQPARSDASESQRCLVQFGDSMQCRRICQCRLECRGPGRNSLVAQVADQTTAPETSGCRPKCRLTCTFKSRAAGTRTRDLRSPRPLQGVAPIWSFRRSRWSDVFFSDLE
jgi:hypothetical protein